MRALVPCLALLALLLPAAADGAAQDRRLVTDVSRGLVELGYNFDGADLLVYGAIAPSLDREAEAAIVVVLEGPPEPVLIRRKEQQAGIWLNADSVRIPAAPGFYVLASSAPLERVAPPMLLKRLALGPERLALDLPPGAPGADWRGGFIRNMQRAGLYRQQAGSVRILDGALFRADIRLPTNVPVGEFKARALLFEDGRLTAHRSLPVRVDKIGFERRIYNLAHDRPLAYGLLAALIALAAGWGAGAVTQRR